MKTKKQTLKEWDNSPVCNCLQTLIVGAGPMELLGYKSAPERLKPSLLKTQTGPHKGVMEFCRHLSSRGAMQRKEEKGKKRKCILLTQLKYTASNTASASDLTLNIYYLYLTWVKSWKSNSCISSGHHEGRIYTETPPMKDS